MGIFQYFLLYACPRPGSIAERNAAFEATDLFLLDVSGRVSDLAEFRFTEFTSCATALLVVKTKMQHRHKKLKNEK
jgi:hypothetical protein